MSDLISIIPVAVAAFLATNLDNFFLLLSFVAGRDEPDRSVFFGYMTGMLILVGLSMIAIVLPSFVPIQYLGLLGLVPVTAGVIGMVNAIRTRQEKISDSPDLVIGQTSLYSTVVLTQLANGTDTILIFAPLIADSFPAAVILIFLTFIVMTLFLWQAARYAGRHPVVTTVTRRIGRYLAPLVLILVGVYIFANTATDLMPG